MSLTRKRSLVRVQLRPCRKKWIGKHNPFFTYDSLEGHQTAWKVVEWTTTILQSVKGGRKLFISDAVKKTVENRNHFFAYGWLVKKPFSNHLWASGPFDLLVEWFLTLFYVKRKGELDQWGNEDRNSFLKTVNCKSNQRTTYPLLPFSSMKGWRFSWRAI